MSKFIENKKAIMSLTITQLGLIIATAILLTAAVSVVFLNDWQKKEDIVNIASNFSTIVQGMDTRFFENTTTFYFPEKTYNYNVSISTEYITINTSGTWFNTLSIKQHLIKKPLLNRENKDWITGTDFHIFLNGTYGSFGNKTDPIHNLDVNSVKNEISKIVENASFTFSTYPSFLNLKKPVFIEQVLIYYDINADNKWDNNNDEKQSFVLVYQL